MKIFKICVYVWFGICILIHIAVVKTNAAYLVPGNPTTNTIVYQEWDPTTTVLYAEEDYSETALSPYAVIPTQTAVIAQSDSAWMKAIYFDDGPGGTEVVPETLLLSFLVTNNSGHDWNGYHFITELEPTDLGAGPVWCFNYDSYSIRSFQYGETSLYDTYFWNSDDEVVEDGEDMWAILRFQGLQGISAQISTFNMAQVATTVPVPGAVWLFASGLIGLVGIRRKIHK